MNKKSLVLLCSSSEMNTRKERESFLKEQVSDTINPDKFLYFKLDGSEEQLKKCFGDIESAAVYTFGYDGIIGFDITKLLLNANEKAANIFFDMLEEYETADRASLVFFIEDNDYSKTQAFISRLSSLTELNVSDFGRGK